MKCPKCGHELPVPVEKLSIEEYEERAIPRLELIDIISAKCDWGKFDFECSQAARDARERWYRLMDLQTADEIAAGL